MIGPWHGDPCSRCFDRKALHLVPRPARIHGMCTQCWYGATETQRRDAIFDEQADDLLASEAGRAAAVAALRTQLDAWGMAA